MYVSIHRISYLKHVKAAPRRWLGRGSAAGAQASASQKQTPLGHVGFVWGWKPSFIVLRFWVWGFVDRRRLRYGAGSKAARPQAPAADGLWPGALGYSDI